MRSSLLLTLTLTLHTLTLTHSAITWRTLSAGLEEASSASKPAVVVVRKSWCVACRKLLPQIESSASISALAQDFVMIDCGDDCDGSAYAPDGTYVPRILLLDAGTAALLPEQYNFAARPETKYFYSTASELHETMQRHRHHQQHLEL